MAEMRTLVFLLIFTALASCSSKKGPDEESFAESLEAGGSGDDSVSGELVKEIVQQIPSPLEISVLLRQSGKSYNPDYLNSTDNVHRYNTSYKKALNIGIYGTDLGYTNIYEQNQEGIKYILVIEQLAKDLNIGQFFDVKTIGRLATNSKNIDSLLLITTQNFNDINQYLQNQSRANLSVLLLVGGWLEAMHITCNVAASDPKNKELVEKIGEQKIILESVMQILEVFKNTNENMASLLTDMKELAKGYESVQIDYTYHPSSFEVVNGVMVVKDNSVTTITISEADVANIRSLVNNVRGKIIS